MSFISFNWYENLLVNFKKILNNKADLINGKVPDEQLSDYIRSKPDWNENNPENATYIKNRTHYSNGTTTTENVIVHVEETTIETASQYGDSGLFEFKPSLNTKYIVIFDGVEYECDSYFTNYGRVGVGDDSTPFFMEYDDYDQEIEITTNELGVHTIRIISIETVTTENVQKLDKKYLDMSWEALDDKPFEDKGRENLFVLYDDQVNTGYNSATFYATIKNLNIYDQYDFVIRGDVYRNVVSSGAYSNYYTFVSWGSCKFEPGYFYWKIGDYPFILNVNFHEYDYDSDGNIITASGLPSDLYSGGFIVDINKYPDLDPKTEIQIYRSEPDIKHLDYRYMPEGYPKAKSETKIIYNQNFTISEDNPFVFGVGIPDLVRGQAYTVILDNVEYKCIAVDDGYGGEALGNFYVVGEGEDTGEPFFIFEEYNDDPYACGIAVNTAGDHTVSIKTSVEEIVTIDPKFIQDAYYTEGRYVATYCTLEISSTSRCRYLPTNNFDLVPGAEYIIEIDGEKYYCTAYEIDGIPMLGNGSLRGYSHPNSAEYVPVFVCLPDNTGGRGLELWGSDEVIGDYHDYSVYGTIETVHKLDFKYLPSTIINVSEYSNADGDPIYSVDITPDELINSLKNNITVTVQYDGYMYPLVSTLYLDDYEVEVGFMFENPYEGYRSSIVLYGERGYGFSVDVMFEEMSSTDDKMDKNNPVGTGSFSMNRKSGTSVGDYSYTDGYNNEASGRASHVEGEYTIAKRALQHIEGRYNIVDTSGLYNYSRGKYIHIAGNGTSEDARSNAHTLDWDGNAWFAGDVYVDSKSGKNKDDGSIKLIRSDEVITIEEIDSICDYISHKLIMRTLSGNYVNKTVESIGDYAFANCSITSVDFPVATNIGTDAFFHCIKLANINFPVATNIGIAAFSSCSVLTTADFPVVTSIGESAFNACTVLKTLILRSETIARLSDADAFESTPIASGTGHIYVPAALVDSYKAATNWSTYANQFRTIEDYPEICGGEA